MGLALTYGAGNVALNVLNLFWYVWIRSMPDIHSIAYNRFTKMVTALRKRFGKPRLPNGSADGHASRNKPRKE
jgi:hypothetical protein